MTLSLHSASISQILEPSPQGLISSPWYECAHNTKNSVRKLNWMSSNILSWWPIESSTMLDTMLAFQRLLRSKICRPPEINLNRVSNFCWRCQLSYEILVGSKTYFLNCTNLITFVESLIGFTTNLTWMYLQPHYDNGVFGNVYLLALDSSK